MEGCCPGMSLLSERCYLLSHIQRALVESLWNSGCKYHSYFTVLFFHFRCLKMYLIPVFFTSAGYTLNLYWYVPNCCRSSWPHPVRHFSLEDWVKLIFYRNIRGVFSPQTRTQKGRSERDWPHRLLTLVSPQSPLFPPFLQIIANGIQGPEVRDLRTSDFQLSSP